MRLGQVFRQFFMGPVGAVEPLLGGTCDDPAADLVGQSEGDLAWGAWGVAWAESVQVLSQRWTVRGVRARS